MHGALPIRSRSCRRLSGMAFGAGPAGPDDTAGGALGEMLPEQAPTPKHRPRHTSNSATGDFRMMVGLAVGGSRIIAQGYREVKLGRYRLP
jgi:hypothetical protein